MSMKINAVEFKKGDLFRINPEEIVVVESLRRRWQAPSAETIVEMAESLLTHGQQQPVKCRRLPDNRLQQVSGFTRNAAARLIRAGFTGTDGVEKQDPSFLLQTTVVDCNDEQAAEANIIENGHRNDTSAIDDATNHNYFREVRGWNDAEITKFYGYRDVNKVGNLRRLLQLPDYVKQLIHERLMPVSAGLELLDLPQEQWEAAIKAATNGAGKVNGVAIAAQVRDAILRDEENAPPTGNGTPTVKVKKKARTPKEIRTFFEELAEEAKQGEEGVNIPLLNVCEGLLKFFAGQRSDKWMRNTLIAEVTGLNAVVASGKGVQE